MAALYQTADWKTEKHVPVIDDPVKEGDLFKITVSVGKEIDHPNTTQHRIRWIDLIFWPEGQEPRPEGTGLGMVVLMQVLTRLSFNNMLELPVLGYKNVGMHTLVPTTSVEPLNTTLTKFLWDTPDMACRRVLNSCTGGLYHGSV